MSNIVELECATPGRRCNAGRDVLADAREAGLAHLHAAEAQRLSELATLFRSVSITLEQASRLMLEMSAR